MHLIQVSDEQADNTCRNSVGGHPFLPAEVAVPCCRICNEEMALFLQLCIRAEFGLPFQEGSQLIVFMCPSHNECSDGVGGDETEDGRQPEKYWETVEGHYCLYLFPPGEFQPARLDKRISSRKLQFEQAEEEVQDWTDFKKGSYDSKVGGVPGWMNYSVEEVCSCGGKISFVCQVSETEEFEATPEYEDDFEAPYTLFLGNQVYILACEEQCNPRAVVAVCDN